MKKKKIERGMSNEATASKFISDRHFILSATVQNRSVQVPNFFGKNFSAGTFSFFPFGDAHSVQRIVRSATGWALSAHTNRFVNCVL